MTQEMHGWKVYVGDDLHITISREDTPGEIQIVCADEGYAVDLWQKDNSGEPVVGTWATFAELEEEPE